MVIFSILVVSLSFGYSFYSAKHSMLFPLTINQSVSVMVNVVVVVVVVFFVFIFWRKHKNQQANVHMCWVYLTVIEQLMSVTRGKKKYMKKEKITTAATMTTTMTTVTATTSRKKAKVQ